MKIISNNKKAYYDYFVENKLEAGIVLVGTEVKSLRAGKASIKEAYIDFKNMEVFIRGLNISPYEYGNIYNLEPTRIRKLLLHKSEIHKLYKVRQQDGYTIIPLSIYFDNNSKVKVELGICKGKKNYDKRQTIAKRDSDLKIKRYLKR